jgi:hypothetical protein
MNASDRPAPALPSFVTLAQERQDEPVRPVRQETSAINVERIDRNINESLRKQIVDIITKNPDFALAILRGWKDR